jgi:hypothetical protein
MTRMTKHTWLLSFPFGASPAGGRLDGMRKEVHGKVTDLILDYHELKLSGLPVVFEKDGKPWEKVEGVSTPRRIRFTAVQFITGEELCNILAEGKDKSEGLPISGALAFRYQGRNHYLIDILLRGYPNLYLLADECLAEEREGAAQAVSFERDWSTPPIFPVCIVPNPVRLRQQFGGDPITFRLGKRIFHKRLFIGGVDIQGEQRPDVDVVLNLGEDPSRWTKNSVPHPQDVWRNKGEGSKGMSAAEIAEEAHWVIEHLRTGKRVLVHCSAGMNRSATICCAVLILLEKLSAEDALERVRQHHPWARPDTRHWLALRWLAR